MNIDKKLHSLSCNEPLYRRVGMLIATLQLFYTDVIMASVIEEVNLHNQKYLHLHGISTHT